MLSNHIGGLHLRLRNRSEVFANLVLRQFDDIAEAKEGEPFLEEFRAAGFAEATLLRATRNARTKKPMVLAAEGPQRDFSRHSTAVAVGRGARLLATATAF